MRRNYAAHNCGAATARLTSTPVTYVVACREESAADLAVKAAQRAELLRTIKGLNNSIRHASVQMRTR